MFSKLVIMAVNRSSFWRMVFENCNRLIYYATIAAIESLSKKAGCERGVKRGFAKHRKPNGLMDTVIAENGPGSFQKLEVQKILVSNS